MTVNGQGVPLTTGEFGVDLPAGPEGPRDIVLVASDAAGNRSSKTVSIILDRTAPVVTIASPAENAVVAVSTVVVSGTVSDATSVSVTVQGTDASVVGHAFSATLSGLSDGPLAINVRARDAAGNEAIVVRNLDLDLTPPVVAIMSPAPSAVTRAATAQLTYTVTDRSTTTIKVNGVSVEGCGGVAQGYTDARPACERTQSVDLADGDNTFTVEATEIGRAHV